MVGIHKAGIGGSFDEEVKGVAHDFAEPFGVVLGFGDIWLRTGGFALAEERTVQSVKNAFYHSFYGSLKPAPSVIPSAARDLPPLPRNDPDRAREGGVIFGRREHPPFHPA